MMKQVSPIYIVDDDERVRTALCRLLRSAGYKAESFSSPKSFLDSVPLHASSGVLILDIRMADMDGFALHQKIKEFHSDLATIFITGHAEPGDRERAMSDGAAGFLLKPFSDESLLELINKAMNRGTEERT